MGSRVVGLRSPGEGGRVYQQQGWVNLHLPGSVLARSFHLYSAGLSTRTEPG